MPGEAMATTVVDAISMVHNGPKLAFPREPLYTEIYNISILIHFTQRSVGPLMWMPGPWSVVFGPTLTGGSAEPGLGPFFF